MPVTGGRIKQILRCRLGSHDLAVAVGRHINLDRADRVGLHVTRCVEDECM